MLTNLLRGGALFALTVLAGCSGSGSSSNGPQVFTQIDRVGKPGVNAIFATMANNQRQNNMTDAPANDNAQLHPEIAAFMTGSAGRSAQTANAVANLLSPSVLTVDLSQSGPAGYLAVETNGATEPTQHARFGGRKLTDDVMTANFSLIFGNQASTLQLAPDDGLETPALTNDHVTAATAPKHFQDGSPGFAAAQFPYLGPPQ